MEGVPRTVRVACSSSDCLTGFVVAGDAHPREGNLACTMPYETLDYSPIF